MFAQFNIVFRLAGPLIALLMIAVCPEALSAAEPAAPVQPHPTLSLPSIFSDYMVLQQGKACVWGSGEPWAVVTIVVGPVATTAKASVNGSWRAELKGLKAPGPYTMVVTDGSTTLTFKQVAVGQVWVCAGSTSMDESIASVQSSAQEATPGNPDIRFFKVPQSSAYQPPSSVNASWQVASANGTTGVSAIATYFATEIGQRLTVPIGIIQTTLPGAPAEAFVPIEALSASDILSPVIRWYDRNRPAKDAAPADLQAFAARLPAGAWSAMVAPIVPYTISGALFDRGESNTARGAQYGVLLPTLIKSWRKTWGQGDFPFLYAQAPPSGLPSDSPADSSLAELRDGQNDALALPNTVMEATLDLFSDPKNKLADTHTLARRLATAAVAKTTAEKIEYMGPVYRSLKVENGAVRLKFDHAEGGLGISDGDFLRTFQIAGPDRTWHWADARIEGHDVIVSLHEVTNPVAVRYAWSDNWVQSPSPANLINRAGFPAGTFRTDDWPEITDSTVAGGDGFGAERKTYGSYR